MVEWKTRKRGSPRQKGLKFISSRQSTRLKQALLEEFVQKKVKAKISREYLRKLCHKLVASFRRKAGISSLILVKFDKRGKRLADVRFKAKRGLPEIHINIKHLMEIYEIDPKLARKFLEYGIAHEICHIKQMEKYGVEKMRRMLRFLIEHEAEQWTYELLGTTQKEIDEVTSKLREKLSEKYGIKPKPPPSPNAPRLRIKGKIAARVLAWESAKTGKMILPRQSITERNKDYTLPRKVKSVWIVEFDEMGRPIPRSDKFVSREELKNYYLVP